MSDTSNPTATLTAKDIGLRVIKWVQSLQSPADLLPEKLEQATGLKVEFNREDKQRYGVGGQVNDNWHFGLTAIPDKAGSPPRRATFKFDDRSADGKADLAPVCSLSFNDYRDALVGAGYTMQRVRTGRNNDFWRFTRGSADVSLWPLRYADPEKGPACVGTLDVRV